MRKDLMNDLQVVVSVSDKYLWCLAPFAHLFNKYWSPDIPVVVAGYSPPWFELPKNFSFYSIAPVCYPKEKWVDGFLKFLYQYEKDYFVLMLEDYWTCRKVNVDAINKVSDYMFVRNDCLRIDLTSDRLYAGDMKDIGYFGEFDIVEAAGSPYQMSLQAGIWNKRLFIDVLEKLPNDKHSAWDVELEGTGIVNVGKMHIVGTRQNPVRYINGMNNASKEVNIAGFIEEDRTMVKEIINDTIRGG